MEAKLRAAPRTCFSCKHYRLDTLDARCDATGAPRPWAEMVADGGPCAGEHAPLWALRPRPAADGAPAP